jgi:hypothetical protein
MQFAYRCADWIEHPSKHALLGVQNITKALRIYHRINIV